MRQLIFLDFDGVLHPDGVGLFSKRELVESYLLQMPNAEIVISSTWREDHSLQQLQQLFSAVMRPQIIGCTPILENGYDRGGRQREIDAYLASAGLTAANCSWVAIDDLAYFFDDNCPNLILTDSNTGFAEHNGQAVLHWYRQHSADKIPR